MATWEGSQRTGPGRSGGVERGVAQQGAEAGPHAIVMGERIVPHLGWGHRSQQVVRAGRGAIHEHQPSALEVGQAPETIHQDLLLVDPGTEVGRDKLGRANGRAEDLDTAFRGRGIAAPDVLRVILTRGCPTYTEF